MPINFKSTPGFLLKTFEILESEKYFDMISWNLSGESFIVKD